MKFLEYVEEDPHFEELIKRGLSLSSDRDNSVWDNLLNLINSDRENLASLLGVREEALGRAAGNISKILSKVRDKEISHDKRRKKSMMLHTGI